MTSNLVKFIATCFLASSFLSCGSMYYGAMNKMGFHKRDILKSRVAKARDSQEDARGQFKTALERFTELVEFDGENLEDRYNTLDAELQSSESQAQSVHKRVNAVENVAEALFKEWEAELVNYSNEKYRRSSQDKLQHTRSRYEQLLLAMRKAESKIEPVLMIFRDQVLFLKHNLNARAVSSLQEEAPRIETQVEDLIREMERSINEADEFIATL